MTKFIKPSVLKPGDTVRVVASSSPFNKESFLDGVSILEGLGLRVKYRKDIFAEHPYLAGSDARRFGELKQALEDDSTNAVFFARGGYGAMRLIPFLQKIKIKAHPKIIAGFSDVTTLHLYLQKFWHWNSFYAPMIGGNMRQMSESFTLDSFRRTLMDPRPLGRFSFPDIIVVKRGLAKAKLVGGCLTLVTASLGTPFEIGTDGHILFVEDVHEKPYQIDRLLMQLKLAGKFKKCRGLIFGVLNGPNPVEHYVQTVREVFHDVDFPILMNFPSGHIPKTFTLPFGTMIEIKTRDKSLTFLESPFSC